MEAKVQNPSLQPITPTSIDLSYHKWSPPKAVPPDGLRQNNWSPLGPSAADVTSPCFDLTGRVQAVLHMQVLWQMQLRKGRSRQQGGTDYSAVDSPGGLLSRGDCPLRDSPAQTVLKRLEYVEGHE